jgi:hypothetical protein
MIKGSATTRVVRLITGAKTRRAELDHQHARPKVDRSFVIDASDLGGASGLLVALLTGRLQRHVPGQGGNPVQPNAHPRVGFEVEATLVGDRRVNVEGDVSDRGTISDKELAVA